MGWDECDNNRENGAESLVRNFYKWLLTAAQRRRYDCPGFAQDGKTVGKVLFLVNKHKFKTFH